MIYGHIFPARGQRSSSYWRAVGMGADAAKAISRHYNGDDRAAHHDMVFVRTAAEQQHLVELALALTGRRSAIAH